LKNWLGCPTKTFFLLNRKKGVSVCPKNGVLGYDNRIDNIGQISDFVEKIKEDYDLVLIR